MLTTEQIARILAAAASYDSRRPADAPVVAWGKAAEAGRWTYDEALAAVVQHYTHSTEFLMPGHVTALIKSARADRALRQRPQIGAADPVACEQVHQRIAEIGRTLGWPGADQPGGGRTVLRVACPHCRAGVGQRCVGPAGKPLTKSPHHPARAAAAGEAAS